MYKVLLAEDEEWILQGIRNIIDWEELGLSVVHMAHNGNEAIECMLKEPVDIIVTDINMPGMDGLTMLKKIREKNEKVRFIILSGYDDFQYAQTAIRLNVEGYILKPIDEDELTEVLEKAIQVLQAEEQKPYEYLEESRSLYHYLEDETVERQELLNEYGIRMENPYGTAVHIKIKQKNLKEDTLANILAFLDKDFKGVTLHKFCFVQEEIFVFIFLDFDDSNIVESFFATLQNEIEAMFEVFTFVTISQTFTNLEGLRLAYKETKKLQRYLMIEGYGSIISSKTIDGRTSKDMVVNNEQFRKLILSKQKKK